MIVIKLWGGTCNQLFQYAFGYVLAKEHNDCLVFDTSFYINQPKHVGKRMLINNEKFPSINLNNEFNRTPLINFIENKYVSHIIRHSKGINIKTADWNILVEKLYHFYDNVPYSKNKVNYYDGYWQSAKYLEGYRSEILKLFTPNITIVAAAAHWRETVNSDCCVAVHIRRGDYVRSGNKSITQSIEYYKSAMHYMQKECGDPTFCIFSDDIAWCKKEFSNVGNVVYVENQVKDGDLIDLYSISLCQHGIMSISTFSWWGNWLRKDLSKSIVIYPEGKYFNDFFMPDEWKCFSINFQAKP